MARSAPHPEGMSPLQALIVTTMDRKKLTRQDVEANGVKHATLARYIKPMVLQQTPRPATLRAIADGLGIDLAEVEEAAKASVGAASPAWRGQKVLALDRGLDVRLIVDRVDRKPITEADLWAGSEAMLAALKAEHRKAASVTRLPQADPLTLPHAARKRAPKRRT